MRNVVQRCAVVLVLLTVAWGCRSESDDPPAVEGAHEATGEGGAEAEAGEGEEAEAAAEAEAPAEPEAPADPNAGRVPGLEYPAVPTRAIAGQAVFAPQASTLTSRAADETARLDWYAATMVTPGAVESELQPQYGSAFTCPNSLIVPVPADQTAVPGAAVVSNSVSGLVMGRVQSAGDNGAATIVQFNGTRHQPEVRPAGKWWVPASDGAPGTAVFCTSGRREGKYTLIHSTGQQHLVADNFGAASVVPVADCATIPLSAPVEAGTEIRGYALGGLKDLTVTEIASDTGVITASFDFVGETREATFVPGEYTLR